MRVIQFMVIKTIILVSTVFLTRKLIDRYASK